MPYVLPKNPFETLSREEAIQLLEDLRRNALQLLQVRSVRQRLAFHRFRRYSQEVGEVQHTDATAQIVGNTIKHNIASLKQSVGIDRPMLLLYPVLGLETVWKNAGNLRVLSIGPRSEMEIFSLLAGGFRAENIKALDLISYSPYVDIGDMHAMPYEADSFDVILLGWVIAYSRDVSAMAREVIRCAADRAVVAISADYADEASIAAAAKDTSLVLTPHTLENPTMVQTCQQLLAPFAGHVGEVFFRHEPEPPHRNAAITVFEVRK
jgi:hypothetical protein